MKNICIFCSSSDAVAPLYYEAAEELSAAIAKRGLTLVYGGCKVGLMGRVAETAKKNGGKVIGIIPKNIHVKGLLQEGLDELIITENMRERKALMEEKADAFIALPGGFGTLEEILEMLTYRQLKIHAKPIIFLNTNDFYSPLISFFESFYHQKFAKAEQKKLYLVADKIKDVFDYLETFRPSSLSGKWF
jgi:uncharacterized protein (TIGR00730 family)